MSDPIELSREEEQAAYFALSPLLAAVALNRQQPDYAVTPVVNAIIKAVNKVRAGDPIGTVRRSDTGVIGLRCYASGVINRWCLIDSLTGKATWSDDCDWPVIFSPEAS